MKIQTPLTGTHILLNSLDASMAEGAYYTWMQDKDILQDTEARFQGHSKASLQSFITHHNDSRDRLLLGIFLKENGQHIGNIKLAIEGHHQRGDIGIIIGDKTQWGKGYAAEAILLLKAYAFHTLQLVKLTAGCYETNQGSEKAFLKAGFVREGYRPMHCNKNGMRVGVIQLGLVHSNEK